jgi:hypothetical protein
VLSDGPRDKFQIGLEKKYSSRNPTIESLVLVVRVDVSVSRRDDDVISVTNSRKQGLQNIVPHHSHLLKSVLKNDTVMSVMRQAIIGKCTKIAALAARDHNVARPISTFLPFSSVSSSRTERGMSTFMGETTFTPATPAKTKGTPMFKDVDFAIAKDPLAECVVRNADPKAVFVVTGAGRGLGLEFAKQLVDRTKVRFIKQTMKAKVIDGIY